MNPLAGHHFGSWWVLRSSLRCCPFSQSQLTVNPISKQFSQLFAGACQRIVPGTKWQRHIQSNGIVSRDCGRRQYHQSSFDENNNEWTARESKLTPGIFAALALCSSATFLYIFYPNKTISLILNKQREWEEDWDSAWRPNYQNSSDTHSNDATSVSQTSPSDSKVNTECISETSHGKNEYYEKRQDVTSLTARVDDVDRAVVKKEEEDAFTVLWRNARPKSLRHLLLVRHGQYLNPHKGEDAIQGLTKLGEKQAHLTGQRLAQLLEGKKCLAIYHSNLKRAKETANIIRSHLPHVEKFEQDPLLAEGIPALPNPESASFRPTIEEVQKDRPRIDSAFSRYFYRAKPPTEENVISKNSNLTEPTQRTAGKVPNDTSGEAEFEIIVCHGNVIRYFFLKSLQFPPNAWLRLSTYNCGVTWICIDSNGRVTAREFGNVGHLPVDFITYH